MFLVSVCGPGTLILQALTFKYCISAKNSVFYLIKFVQMQLLDPWNASASLSWFAVSNQLARQELLLQLQQVPSTSGKCVFCEVNDKSYIDPLHIIMHAYYWYYQFNIERAFHEYDYNRFSINYNENWKSLDKSFQLQVCLSLGRGASGTNHIHRWKHKGHNRVWEGRMISWVKCRCGEKKSCISVPAWSQIGTMPDVGHIYW